MEAAALELEDDAFFKDLSKQISLLIMDDDESVFDGPLSHCPWNLQAFNQVILPSAQAASYLGYNQETSKRGTGVFIPRSTNPRRKNAKQQGKFSAASGNKLQKHCDHSSRRLPQMAYANKIDHSSNPSPMAELYLSHWRRASASLLSRSVEEATRSIHRASRELEGRDYAAVKTDARPDRRPRVPNKGGRLAPPILGIRKLRRLGLQSLSI